MPIMIYNHSVQPLQLVARPQLVGKRCQKRLSLNIVKQHFCEICSTCCYMLCLMTLIRHTHILLEAQRSGSAGLFGVISVVCCR